MTTFTGRTTEPQPSISGAAHKADFNGIVKARPEILHLVQDDMAKV